MRAVVASLWMLVAAGAHGQPAHLAPFALPAQDLAALARGLPRHDEFSAAFLIDEFRYDLDERHRLTWSRYRVYRVDADDAIVELGQVQAFWEPHRQQRPEIRARVIGADGREYGFDPATLADESVRDPDPRIFDDVRQLRGPLPAIVVGSVVELQVRVVDLEPLFAAGRAETVWPAIDVAVERTRIVVSAPVELPLRHAARLWPDARISEEYLDGRRMLTLEHGPLALDSGEFHLLSLGEQPVWPQFSFSTGDSWDGVARAYATLAEPFVRAVETRELLPARLPEGREARIAKLLEILHARVRYTGVLFGIGKLVPNPPSVTLERRYGDCKDKAVVLASMLRAAGLPAELALLSSGDGIDIDPELPGIGGFNHMIVHVPGASPLWIDPTVEHMKVGELPFENRGRWALIVGSTGSALLRTPAARPGDLQQSVTREYRLADVGPADLRISARVNGSDAQRKRQEWFETGTATDRRRKEMLQAVYEAKSITGFELAEDDSDGFLTYRFDARGVKTGHTYLEEAVVRESLAPLLNRIPSGLRRDDETIGRISEVRAQSGGKPQIRTADWVFEPFRTEWKLRIVPPPGFRLRSSPGELDLRLGPARFARRFELDNAGHVLVSVSLDSGSGRYTVEEGEAFRSTLMAHAAEFQLELRFEHEAAALAAAGDEAGALRRHREFIAAEPAKAIHLLRAAHQLLDYGVVPEARDLSRRATVLEPDSALAFIHLGNALTYNESGEKYGRGFNRDGAIKAYQQAIRLDPQNHTYRLSLGATAAYADDGSRFVADADLELAIASYREFLKAEPAADSVPWAILTCLWELGRYGQIVSEAAGYPDDAGVQPIRLAAQVMTVGVEAALGEETSRGTATARRERIEKAVARLWRSRFYAQARELLSGFAGEVRAIPGFNRVLTQMLRKAVRVEELPDPPATAAGVAESLMRTAILRDTDVRDLEPLLSVRARGNGDIRWFHDYLYRHIGAPHEMLVRALDGRRDVARDVALSNLEFAENAAPGDLRKVTVRFGDGSVLTLFLVPEANGWRVLTLAPVWHPVGREVVAHLDAGDSVTARALLELARDESEWAQVSGMYYWLHHLARALPRTSGEADEAALRLGALFLLIWPDLIGAGLKDIQAAESLAITSGQRAAWHWLVYGAAQQTGQYDLMVDAARGIQGDDTDSVDAYPYLINSLQLAGRWYDAERMGRAFMSAQPNDERALWAVIGSLNAMGRSHEGLELIAALVRDGRSGPRGTIQYAWQALIADAVDDGVLQAAESAYHRQSQSQFAVGHVLACIYAASGRVKEARDLAERLLEQHPEVNSDSGDLWLMRGLIFEHLGETAAAARAYRKVGVPTYADRNSVAAVAIARLAKLNAR
jgi:transglutaminase-like putative cysteine protease/tetratricopeptide (TPR) repeat protein